MSIFVNSPCIQNYYIEKGVAYTEDKIIIHKLYINKIAPHYKEQDLLKYFSRYGRVLRVVIFGSPKPNPNPNYKGKKPNHGRPMAARKGFVHFANPRDAANALIGKIVPKRVDLHVQPSDSWHQPEAYAHPRQQTNEPQTADIFKLNDHCLEHILTFLNLTDQIRFARTCRRFRGVYQMATPALHKTIILDSFDNMTVWDMRDFFTLSGPVVQSLEGVVPQHHRQRFLDFLGGNCRNLKTLHITSSELRTPQLYRIFQHMTKLESLSLRFCSLKNAGLLALRRLTSLRFLDLSTNYGLTGLNFDQLPESIETLICPCNLLPSFLPDLCNRLPKLKALNIRQMKTMTIAAFNLMIDLCPSLETLIITSCPIAGYEQVAKLPKLTSLSIHSSHPFDSLRPELFSQLAEFKSEQLKFLEVIGQDLLRNDVLTNIGKLKGLNTLSIANQESLLDADIEKLLDLENLKMINLSQCKHVTGNAIVRLILACPRLNYVQAEGCWDLQEDHIRDIIRKVGLQLKNKNNVRELPIKMGVSHTCISQLFLQDKDYIDAKEIIEVSIDRVPPRFLLQHFFGNLTDFFAPDLNRAGFDFDTDDDLDFGDDQYLFDVGFLDDEDVGFDPLHNFDVDFEIDSDNSGDEYNLNYFESDYDDSD